MKEINKRMPVMGIAIWLILIWLHTFVRIVSYENSKGKMGYMLSAIIAVVVTLFYYWCIVGGIDAIEDTFDISISRCMTITGTIWLAMIIALVLEMFCDGFSLYSYTSIYLWILKIPKKYIFDVYAIIIFPLFMELIFKSMSDEKLSKKTLTLGCMQILGITIIGYLIFCAMNNIWTVELLLLNVTTIICAAYKYIGASGKMRKGNLAAVLIFYVLACIILLGMSKNSGENIYEYMYAGNWNEYKANVNLLINNAVLGGMSPNLKDSGVIHEFLYNRSNYIHQALYYGGWIVAATIVIIILAFVVILVKMLDIRKYYIQKHYLVYMAALWTLLIRSIMGIMYSFALVPYPTALPFAGTTGLITDSMAFALLIICSFQNYKLDRILNCTVVSVDFYLEQLDTYSVRDADTGDAYAEEFLDDKVIVKGTLKEIICTVEWSVFSEGEYAVFTPLGGDKIFVLEHIKDEMWKPIEDENLINGVYSEYKDKKLSECMEGIGFEDN